MSFQPKVKILLHFETFMKHRYQCVYTVCEVSHQQCSL